MPVKWNPPDAQDFVNRYTAGESIQALAARYRVTPGTIRKRLQEAGVRFRSPTEAAFGRFGKRPPDEEAIVALYEEGIASPTIASRFGIEQSTVLRILRRRGIMARGSTESLRLTLASLSAEDRRKIYGNVWRGRVGRPVTPVELHKRALTREGRFLSQNNSDAERILRQWLIEAGVTPVINKAIGPYTADLGADSVAMEVFGGNRHGHGKHAVVFPKRCRYILDAGWNLVIVWRCRFFPLTRGSSEYLISFLEKSRSDPAFRRQYRVIGGNGQELLAHSGDFDDFAFVPPGC